MDADVDPLLIAVFCTADDLLLTRAENAKQVVTDAEVVTLAIAEQLLGINSDEQFCAGADRRLGHLSPRLDYGYCASRADASCKRPRDQSRGCRRGR